MHTSSGEAFKDDAPSFLISASYLDGVWTETIYSRRPAGWLNDA